MVLARDHPKLELQMFENRICLVGIARDICRPVLCLVFTNWTWTFVFSAKRTCLRFWKRKKRKGKKKTEKNEKSVFTLVGTICKNQNGVVSTIVWLSKFVTMTGSSTSTKTWVTLLQCTFFEHKFCKDGVTRWFFDKLSNSFFWLNNHPIFMYLSSPRIFRESPSCLLTFALCCEWNGHNMCFWPHLREFLCFWPKFNFLLSSPEITPKFYVKI